jgi:hypothetical protein
MPMSSPCGWVFFLSSHLNSTSLSLMIRRDPVFAWGRILHIDRWRSWQPPCYTSSGSNWKMNPRMLHTKQCLPSTWIKASICMHTHVQLKLPSKLLYALLLLKKLTLSNVWWIILYSNCHLIGCKETKRHHISKIQNNDQTVVTLF